MAFKRMKPTRKPGIATTTSTRYYRELDDLQALVNRKRYKEAYPPLLALNERYPRQVDILYLLLHVAGVLQDYKQLVDSGEITCKIAPNDPDVFLALGHAYIHQGRTSFAIQTFEHFLKRWPQHAEFEAIQEIVVKAKQLRDEFFQKQGLFGEEAEKLALLHEEIQNNLQRGRHREVRTLVQQALAIKPNFPPALNNLSLAYFLEGNSPKAIETAEKILQFDPGNIHALSNLVRFYCSLGKWEEAREFGERLKASQDDATDKPLKVAEALSFLGDDAGVIATLSFKSTPLLKKADSEEIDIESFAQNNPHYQHLLGVASMRLGNEAEARKHWEKAIELGPDTNWAEENLKDLSQPLEARNGPWAFPLGHWMSHEIHAELHAQIAKSGKHEGSLGKNLQAFFQRHPEILSVLPVILERGDPKGREFVMGLAGVSKMPELYALVDNFVLSSHGSDQQRMEALQLLQNAGVYERNTTRMYLRGEWTEIASWNFEIYQEPESKHGDEVTELGIAAMEALHAREGEMAEALLKQALAIEPDSPDLLNNLAAAYAEQGRTEEMRTLVRQIHESYPTYFFGITNAATNAVWNGHIEEAKALVEPLLSQKRLHVSEFVALAKVQIQILLSENLVDSAKSWLGMWEEVYPDHPRFLDFQKRIEQAETPTSLGNLFGKLKQIGQKRGKKR